MACKEDFSVLYHRMPRLFAAPALARDLLEIVEDRYDAGSIVLASQVPVDRWHDIVGNPMLADAILDRIVHNAYRIELAGESMRKRRMHEPPLDTGAGNGPGRCGKAASASRPV